MIRRFALSAMLSVVLFAQPENWTRAFPAHKIAGNLYYVGTEDLACFLIATPEGHILINSGLQGSVPLIRAGVQKLGFKFEDVKILLTMQAHFDHVAGLAEIQRLTGAKMYATEADAPVLEDGGKSDPYLGKKYWFEPIRVHRRLKDGDTIRLGETELRVHLTPGHTMGSVTYSTEVQEGARRHRVLIANMNTVVMPLVGNRKYPKIAEDYARSFRVQKALPADIWVAAHASQYGMQQKLKSASFIDPEGYIRAVAELERAYLSQLEKERTGRKQ